MKDIRGVDLEVGQMVAFAERDGNVAVLRVGTIVSLSEEKGEAGIEWSKPEIYGPKVSHLSVYGKVVKRPRICVIEP